MHFLPAVPCANDEIVYLWDYISSSLSPKILSLSTRLLLALHLMHINTAALENAPKLSSKERKRDMEKRRRKKWRERISRTISSTQTLSCPPVIKVLSSGASKVPLRWDDCWGERERLTLYAVCHRNNSDTLGIIKYSTFFQMDHLNPPRRCYYALHDH